jgi:phage protein D
MSYNDLTDSGQTQVRAPRAWLVIGGKNINIEEFEARLLQAAGQQSTAQVTMALDDPTNPGLQFWLAGGLIPASILATNGDAAGTQATIISGYVDFATIDLGTRTVHAQMSDRGRPLLDTRTDASWTNQTTSAIVTQLAGQAGLATVAGPGQAAGDQDQQGNFVFNSSLEAPWDVIQQLAHTDGYAAFVIGNTLYYVPPGTAGGNTYLVEYVPPQVQEAGNDVSAFGEGSNVEKLICIHNFDLGQGVQFTAMSRNQAQNQSYVAEAGGGAYQGAGRFPNKTQQQVQSLANAGQRLIAQHENTVEVHMAGDVIVNPTMMLQLTGTRSSFDMTYYIYEVIHRMKAEGGYEMEITAYNSSSGSAGSTPPSDNSDQTTTPAPDTTTPEVMPGVDVMRGVVQQ